MIQNLTNKIAQINQDIINNNHSVSKLIHWQNEAKKAFDERIEQLLKESGIVKKIKVPQDFIKLPCFTKKTFQIRLNWRYILSIPFIYGMIIPAIIWHLCIEIYHQICFRLYGIPRVSMREYFIFDRPLLSMLNPIEKINCIYCSYVNNLIRYSCEVGGRTERYWCPIKYYRRINNAHSQYPKFMENNDLSEMRNQWEELRDFSDIK